jgi:hypothetical protein
LAKAHRLQVGHGDPGDRGDFTPADAIENITS